MILSQQDLNGLTGIRPRVGGLVGQTETVQVDYVSGLLRLAILGFAGYGVYSLIQHRKKS